MILAGLTCLTLALVAADPPDAALVALAEAEAEATPGPASPAAVPTDLVIRPAGEPHPALRYRLVPERRNLVPGNAALFYHRAILMAAQTRANLYVPPLNAVNRPGRDIETKIAQWGSGPIAAIPQEEAVRALDMFMASIHEVDLAVQRLDCDWAQFERTEGISMLIPEATEMRTLGRLVQLRTMLAIRDGRVEDAFKGAQTLYVMGRHTADGPTLIGGLVGIALSQIATAMMEHLVQMPGSPNLYWCLVDRPRPFIDLKPAMNWERDVLEREIPGIDTADQTVWSTDQTRRFVADFESKMRQAIGGFSLVGESGVPAPLGLDPGGVVILAAFAARDEAQARRDLVTRGVPADRVAAMPAFQAVLARSYRRYIDLRDNEFKVIGLPAWQSLTRPWAGPTRADKMADPLVMMFASLFPAVQAVEVASARLERRLDALQTAEAIRLHLANHNGQWPASLDALADNPAPVDPATGKPFDYRVSGDMVIVSAPIAPGFPGHHTSLIQLNLKLAR